MVPFYFQKNNIAFDRSINFCKYLACMFFAKSGCGKFQPTNAPTAIQNNVSNMMFSFYLSGNGGTTGAGLPPHPVTTSPVAGAPNPALLPKPAGAWPPNPPPVGAVPQDCVTVVAVGAPNAPGPYCGVDPGI
jgi:hypothetical protein